jgi:hypothetical protein
MVKRDPSKFKSAVRFRYPAPKICLGGVMVATSVLEADDESRVSSSLTRGTN